MLPRRTAGFTLVELAIVLVIIGLLVGGALVGQDLIRAAEIRAVTSDLAQFNTATGAFRTKYAGGIPGDLLSIRASAYGLTVSAVNPGTFGYGDGDGLLVNGGGIGSPTWMGFGGETLLFWRHLSDANMIPFTSTADGTVLDTSGFATASTELTTLQPLLPAVRIRPGVFIHAFANSGRNYFAIANWAGIGTPNGGSNGRVGLTSREAQGIDRKMDDGFPTTGTVFSTVVNSATNSSVSPGNGGSPSTANTLCYDSTVTPAIYATANDDIANSVRCALRIRAGF
jgi:prepilin-type N-terminal cleavage/methylation domain-containing protein